MPIKKAAQAKQVVGKKGKGKTKISHSAGPVAQQDHEVGEVVSAEPLANVGLGLAQTFNLGDYNSARVEVSLHRPCANTDEAIDATYEEVKDWVDVKMQELAEEVAELKASMADDDE